MNILFNKSALEIVLKRLKNLNGYVSQNIKSINRDRYFIVHGFGCPNISILFKREFFHKFGQQGFISKNGKAEKGLGESVNVEHLKKMASEDVKELYFVYPEGQIYKIYLGEILDKGHKWTQKEGTEVYSFSIHLLENIHESTNMRR